MAIEGFFNKYIFLSNFYLCAVKIDDLIYRSSEHAFQAMKATNKKDRLYIRSAPIPYIAKQRGGAIKCRPNWKNIRVDMMYKVVEAKFTQNKTLAAKLLATGDELLVEANYWKDTFWGMYNGEGENWLGIILMEVRQKLKIVEETSKIKEKN